MSFINPFLEDYLAEVSSNEPLYLKKIREKFSQKKDFPLHMSSGAYQGRFLSMISQLQKPKKILEIGTFIGYSTLCLVEGLQKEGRLIALESNERWGEIAIENFKNSPYEKNIDLILGEAHNSLKNLDEKFDLVFVDADKKNYPLYFDLVLPKMQKGGLILCDNVLWRGEVASATTEDKKALMFRKFNEKLKKESRAQTFFLPIRDGISISRVL